MDLMSPREARPWPRRRALSALGGVTILGLLIIGATIGWSRHVEHRATDRSCAALQAPVEGLDTLTWSNGITMAEGSWSTVLLDWHDHLDESEKARVTEAVRADAEGYQRLLDHAEDVIRPDIEVLLGRVAPLITPDLRDLDVSTEVDALRRYLTGVCGIAP